MISASEARRRTENNIDDYVTDEISKITNEIDKAVKNGNFSFCNNGTLRDKTKQKLESLGYKVKTGNQNNDSYYSISW